MSDPASYRTKEELEKYREEDPITRLRAQLSREGKLTNEQFDKLDKSAKEQAMASVKFAEKSAEPPLDELYDYTYAPNDEPNVSSAKTARATKPAKRASSASKARGAADTAASTNGDKA